MTPLCIVCVIVMLIAGSAQGEERHPDIIGVWTATFRLVGVHSTDPKGEFTLVITRQDENGRISGTWSSRNSWGQQWEDRSIPDNARLDGNDFTWSVKTGSWMRATIEGDWMRGHIGWGKWEPWQFTAKKTQSVLNSVRASKTDMSNYENDRDGCRWESQLGAGCMYGGAVCKDDPRPAYNLCMYKLGYTVEGFAPPLDSSAPKN
jgi:hypothetical protein